MEDREKLQNILIDSTCHFEFLFDFTQNVKVYYPSFTSSELRMKSLEVIKILLENRILDVYGFKDEEKWSEPVHRIMTRIDEIWLEDSNYKDLISMIFFKRQSWFYNKLKEYGYDFKGNWKEFVKNKLGDLEEWIKENRPIDE